MFHRKKTFTYVIVIIKDDFHWIQLLNIGFNMFINGRIRK